MSDSFYCGRCSLDLHIENCQSLKAKRRIVSSLKEKLKNRFNVAVCEYGNLSLWQRAQLGIVACSNDKVVVDSIIKAVVGYLSRVHSVSMLDFKIEIL
ncbi:hypothetical protein AMJ52_02130 [candidate division TA06 bacterium DG_78]|uniref:DUF503 domain-containing protein n=1 Tax=candidate division TA06 bacterium DG_78 TaxID=1703772 RepID=A0A0S7YIM3_UNCT6|nr:MAG: hypothetical protein AMJ52_02130 [candidate division TA06 bacterium DG_78]